MWNWEWNFKLSTKNFVWTLYIYVYISNIIINIYNQWGFFTIIIQLQLDWSIALRDGPLKFNSFKAWLRRMSIETLVKCWFVRFSCPKQCNNCWWKKAIQIYFRRFWKDLPDWLDHLLKSTIIMNVLI